ncbi:MAG: hypothetical protein JSW71_00090 [Gemmatimonadota bacterium]|nr:MAG: hypothetical protein JSW71_00090 [Gemmatimonadota bacterium]
MRTVKDSSDAAWRVQIVSHGRTSAYLSQKVHRPVVEFTCTSPVRVRLYATLPTDVDSLEGLDDDRLLRLLEEAKPY